MPTKKNSLQSKLFFLNGIKRNHGSYYLVFQFTVHTIENLETTSDLSKTLTKDKKQNRNEMNATESFHVLTEVLISIFANILFIGNTETKEEVKKDRKCLVFFN
jgi:hypothetical protein